MDTFWTAQVFDAACTGEVSAVKKAVADVGHIDASGSTGKTALWLAIERGNAVAVRTILQAGADVNKTYNSRRTPLMLAADKGRVEILRDLLEAGAHIDSVDSFGMSALMIASQRGYVDCLRFLSRAGASLKSFDTRGMTALMIAVEENQCECVELLLSERIDLDQRDFTGNSLIIISVCQGCETCLRALVRSGANLDQTDRMGKTALMIAVERNSNIVSVLTEVGANVNLCDRRGRTSAMLAAGTGRKNLLLTLIQAGSDLELTDDSGQTALMIAANAGYAECVECLINYVDRQNAQDNTGRSALMLAAAGGHRNCLHHLLRARELKDQQCKSGKTAVHYAVEALSDGCVHELTMSGADINIKDNIHSTPLMHLVKGKCQSENAIKCLHKLLAAGASVNACDREGMTPLMHMTRSDTSGLFFQELVQAGADIHATDVHGLTALHHAASERNLNYVNRLIDAGADINAANHQGVTALGYAVSSHVNMYQKMDFLFNESEVSISRKISQQNKYEAIEFLLSHGANVNACDKYGQSPLMMAIKQSDSQLLTLLVSHGADVNLTDNQGLTALHHVITCYLPPNTLQANVHFLLTHGANANIRAVDGTSVLSQALRKRNYALLLYLLKHNVELAVNRTDLCFIIQVGERRILQLMVQFGIVPCQGGQSTESQSLLTTAVNERELGIAKFLLCVGYLNNFDVFPNRLPKRVMTTFSRRLGPVENRSTDSQAQEFQVSLHSHPWPLVKLSFVAVSSLMGPSPGREQQVKHSGLPQRLQRMLLFQEPISRLCVSQWDSISLSFSTADYETLPKPHPLLFYWPLGRDLEPCTCNMCDQLGFRIVYH